MKCGTYRQCCCRFALCWNFDLSPMIVGCPISLILLYPFVPNHTKIQSSTNTHTHTHTKKEKITQEIKELACWRAPINLLRLNSKNCLPRLKFHCRRGYYHQILPNIHQRPFSLQAIPVIPKVDPSKVTHTHTN